MFTASEFYNLWIFFLVWPLAIIGVLALMLSVALTEVERDEKGNSTEGGKYLIRCHISLMSACGAYILVILFAHLLVDPHQYRFMFWNKYWVLFLALILTADGLAILSTVQGFRARGKGTWVLRIAMPIISIVSILATLSFPHGD